VAAARVDRQTLELQEDLHMMLGHFDPQHFAAVDMRGTVVDALELDVAVGMELRLAPLANVERNGR